MSRGFTPIHAQMAGDRNLMPNSVAFRAAPLSSGRIVPRVTIGSVTPFITRERPNVIVVVVNHCFTSLLSDIVIR